MIYVTYDICDPELASLNERLKERNCVQKEPDNVHKSHVNDDGIEGG